MYSTAVETSDGYASEWNKMRAEKHDHENRMSQTLKEMHESQKSTQKMMIDQFQKQKMFLMEQSRMEREKVVRDRQELLSSIKKRKSSKSRSKDRESPQIPAPAPNQSTPPPVNVPPVHPMFGPAVYDEYLGRWTYPYAQ